MAKLYYDDYFSVKEFSLNENDNIFNVALEANQVNLDKDRFYLHYVPNELMSTFDLSTKDGCDTFRDLCGSYDSPILRMGGCRLPYEEFSRDNGIKMSDPYGNILGSFDYRDGIIRYSSIFPHFYNERDIVKFAHETYFTTMTFEDIMKVLINEAQDYYVHTGNYRTARDMIKYGRFVFEKVSKSEMLGFVTDKEAGVKLLKKTIY